MPILPVATVYVLLFASRFWVYAEELNWWMDHVIKLPKDVRKVLALRASAYVWCMHIHLGTQTQTWQQKVEGIWEFWSLSPFCFLATRRWAVSFTSTMAHSGTMGPTATGRSTMNGIFETKSQNKPSFFLSWFPKVFCYRGKPTNTFALSVMGQDYRYTKA